MPWTRNERLGWALQDFSDRYHIGWVVPKNKDYSQADDERSKAAQRILGIPESKIGKYSYEQLFGTNDDGDGGWIWHPSLYWTGPNPIQNRLRLKRHNDALAYFRRTHGSLYVFPVQGHVEEMRTDRGQDLQTAVGSSILAVGAGVVTATPPGSAVGGLGQIVFRLDHPYQGWAYVYVFHQSNCHVSVGQRLHAGQLLCTTVQNPPGADGMPGWAEYGFALNGFGDIEQDVGSDHFASSGAAMHSLLHRLNPSVIGPNPIRAG